MLTPLNIMSLDQGRQFARQEMKRIYAEPAEVAAETRAPEAAEEVSREPGARKSKWHSLLAQFVGLWEAGYPIGARRS
jgi:hypothetical protein